MPEKTRVVAPGPNTEQVIDEDGNHRTIPAGWERLPPGDAGLTRRVKAAGPTWTVKERRGRRVFSLGVWADAQQIAAAKLSVDADRATESYAKKRQSDLVRREKKQSDYVSEFESAVIAFLKFHPRYQAIAGRLAAAVTTHATPVGSGTVARTQRIPVENRAESAVIAWMRHQTTAYDNLSIPRIKGKRREVRRMLAAQSRELLKEYRAGNAVACEQCPLQRALNQETTTDAN